MNIETLLAPNPGPFTGPGTNTYVVSSDDHVVVIDPGPIIDEHLAAIHSTIASQRPVAVVVTHSHVDHAPLAAPLAAELGVSTFGYAAGHGFVPDEKLEDGDQVQVGSDSLTVIATPGHSDDHLFFQAGPTLFTGDHIIGGSTVMVQHMGDYLRSLERVAGLRAALLLPGHGPRIDNPAEVIDHYIEHRLDREQQIVDAVRAGDGTVGEVVERVYADVDRELHPLAAMSVAAHLRKLHDEQVVGFSEEADLWSAIVEMVVR